MFKEHESIITTASLRADSGELLPAGTSGVIVLIYTTPTLGYEIELFDKESNSYGTVTVAPDQISNRT